jgi:polyisoprenoid-binding protein YceI
MGEGMKHILATAFLLASIASAAPIRAEPVAIDVRHSKLTVYVYKQGVFSMFADNHVVDAPIASGSYDSALKNVAFTVNAAQLAVMDPKLAASRRANVQDNMTGPEVLDAATYHTIAFSSTKIETTDANHWTVTGNLTLHGQTHPETFPVLRVDARHFSGSATVRQSAFGITPIRIAGGAVTVKDDVKVTFDIALNP